MGVGGGGGGERGGGDVDGKERLGRVINFARRSVLD